MDNLAELDPGAGKILETGRYPSDRVINIELDVNQRKHARLRKEDWR